MGLHYLIYHPHYNFFVWSNKSISPSRVGSVLGSGIAFDSPVSVTSFNLKHPHSLPLSCTVLKFLQNTVPHVFNRIFLILCLCAVSFWLAYGCAFLVAIQCRWRVSSLVRYIWRHRMAICPSQVILILFVPSRGYLVSPLLITIPPSLKLVNSLWEDTLRPFLIKVFF